MKISLKLTSICALLILALTACGGGGSGGGSTSTSSATGGGGGSSGGGGGSGDSPTVVVTTDTQFRENDDWEVQFATTGLDADSVTYSVEGATEWMQVDTTQGVISPVLDSEGNLPDAAVNEQVSLTVTATDGSGAAASTEFDLTIYGAIAGIWGEVNNDLDYVLQVTFGPTSDWTLEYTVGIDSLAPTALCFGSYTVMMESESLTGEGQCRAAAGTSLMRVELAGTMPDIDRLSLSFTAYDMSAGGSLYTDDNLFSTGNQPVDVSYRNFGSIQDRSGLYVDIFTLSGLDPDAATAASSIAAVAVSSSGELRPVSLNSLSPQGPFGAGNLCEITGELALFNREPGNLDGVIGFEGEVSVANCALTASIFDAAFAEIFLTESGLSSSQVLFLSEGATGTSQPVVVSIAGFDIGFSGTAGMSINGQGLQAGGDSPWAMLFLQICNGNGVINAFADPEFMGIFTDVCAGFDPGAF